MALPIPNFGFYIAFFIIISIVTFVFFKFNNSIQKFSLSNYLYLLFVLVIPFILFYLFSNSENNGSSEPIHFKTMLFSGIFIMLVLIACSYVYTNLTPQNVVLGTYVLTIILGIIILLTLSILFTIINTHLRSYTGWGGIFIRLLFYLPCLLIDFVEYMKQQFKLTTNTTYILFITELILIIFYLYFPKLATKVLSGTNGTPILSDSRFLTHEYSLNINNMMIKEKKSNKPDQETTKTTYREDFAISMWTYINPQPDNYSAYHNESNIFTFADNTPRITYYNKPDDKNNRNKLVFYYKEDQYTITNEPQKWTNIVLNYSSNNLDIFINGELKRTFTITEPNNYDTLNEIVIGSKNGLDGAICNISFFDKNLSKFEINNIYKLLMNKNPPVNEY
jgi:hypothetical protein